VTANKLDVRWEQKEKEFIFAEVSIPADNNVVQKEAENKLKHQKVSTGTYCRSDT
jgi:hypothetical protein